MGRSRLFICQTRSQAKVEISRRFNRPQATNQLAQLCPPLMELLTITALLQVEQYRRAITLAQHYLVELSTNRIAVCVSHTISLKDTLSFFRAESPARG
jgi:hypothetical protein